MSITVRRPEVSGLAGIVDVLGQWQDDATPMQLHPGDVGWFWRNGSEATAVAIRTWSGDDGVLAVGLLDGPTVLRLAIAPHAVRDTALAHRLAEDADVPGSGVLPGGDACVEAPNGALVLEVLTERGWATGEPWTQLQRDLDEPVESGARIEVVGPREAGIRSAVHRASFDGRPSATRPGGGWPPAPPTPAPGAWWPATTTGPRSRRRRCGRRGRAGRVSSNRWAPTGTIEAGATAGRSPSRQLPRCGSSGARARGWPRPAATSPPSRPTGQQGFACSGRTSTGSGSQSGD